MRGSISSTPCQSEDDADCDHVTCVHAVLCPASTFLSDVGVFYILSSEEGEQNLSVCTRAQWCRRWPRPPLLAAAGCQSG